MDEILSYRQYVRPFYVMAKPAGARCNLRCTYCYYLEKSNLYPAAPAQTMSDELLERFIRDYIAAQAGDATLANWVGEAPGVCTLSKNCGHAGALEFNGDLYACDHFVFPEYKLGNILETPLTELMRGPRQTAFGDAKLRALPTQCRRCRYLFACNGECPRNRFERTREGEPGLNYLCKGYQRFFRHAEPYMDFMRNELMHRRAPANVMEWARKRMGDGR